MKKLIFLFSVILLASCATKKPYTNFDYSYARSGGFDPIYENLWIKGHQAYYSFEGRKQKIKKNFRLSTQDLKVIETVLTTNNFRTIQEDYKKQYDNIAIAINVKKGPNSGSKSNASDIMDPDRERWNNVATVFQKIIEEKVQPAPAR